MQPGEQIGGYTFVSKIAEGGQSIVYLAKDAHGTQVIIKQLKDLHRYDQQLVDRFLQEGEILRTLRHPHLARVFDCLERDGRYFMVQEYLSGGSLANLIDQRERYSEKEALGWSRDALRALNYVHENGIVHRDVKASNLMLDERRRVKLIDFGIARVFGEDRITRAGDNTMGTPWYMSPEQILTPDKVDHLTDVYSMGIVLCELLTGKVPFDGKTPIQVQINITTRQPPPRLKRFGANVAPMKPHATGIDTKLEKIVLRAIEKDKDSRFSGCGEFDLHLGRYLTGTSWLKRLGETVRRLFSRLPAFSLQKAAVGSVLLISFLIIGVLVWDRMRGARRPDEGPRPPAVSGLRVVKSVDPTTVSAAGTVVTYSYTVTNTGNVALPGVSVTDDGATPVLQGGDTNSDGALDEGETWVYEAKVTIAQWQLDAGIAVASPAVASSGTIKSAPHIAPVGIEVRRRMEMATLVNGAKSAVLTAPGPVTYTYNVSNVGNTSLTGVRMTDRAPMKPRFRGGDANSNKILDPGESWQYDAILTITEADVDSTNSFVSRAVAVSDQITSPPDVATVTLYRRPPVRTVWAGTDVPPPIKKKDVRPEYPADAQTAGAQGQVVVALTIGTDGRVEGTRIVTSVPLLDSAALDAAKQWEYAPTVLNGELVRVAMNVGVDFKLAAKAPSTPVRVGGNSMPPKTKDVRPVYPPEAKKARAEGMVIIEVTLTSEGRVQDARILRGIPLLDQAALDCVRQWEYEPTVLKGVPVPVVMTVTVRFPPN